MAKYTIIEKNFDMSFGSSLPKDIFSLIWGYISTAYDNTPGNKQFIWYAADIEQWIYDTAECLTKKYCRFGRNIITSKYNNKCTLLMVPKEVPILDTTTGNRLIRKRAESYLKKYEEHTKHLHIVATETITPELVKYQSLFKY